MDVNIGVGNSNKTIFIGVDKNIKSQKDTIQGIDGLKGLAIIGVTLFHMFPNSVIGGFLGVSLFFSIIGVFISFYNS